MASPEAFRALSTSILSRKPPPLCVRSEGCPPHDPHPPGRGLRELRYVRLSYRIVHSCGQRRISPPGFYIRNSGASAGISLGSNRLSSYAHPREHVQHRCRNSELGTRAYKHEYKFAPTLVPHIARTSARGAGALLHCIVREKATPLRRQIRLDRFEHLPRRQHTPQQAPHAERHVVPRRHRRAGGYDRQSRLNLVLEACRAR